MLFFSLEPASGSSRGGRGGRGDIARCASAARWPWYTSRARSARCHVRRPFARLARLRTGRPSTPTARIAMSLAVHTSNQIVERARISRAAAGSIVSTLPRQDRAPRRPASAATRAPPRRPASTPPNPRSSAATAAGPPHRQVPAPGQLIAGPPARARSAHNPRVKPAGLRSGAELALSGRKGFEPMSARESDLMKELEAAQESEREMRDELLELRAQVAVLTGRKKSPTKRPTSSFAPPTKAPARGKAPTLAAPNAVRGAAVVAAGKLRRRRRLR